MSRDAEVWTMLDFSSFSECFLSMAGLSARKACFTQPGHSLVLYMWYRLSKKTPVPHLSLRLVHLQLDYLPSARQIFISCNRRWFDFPLRPKHIWEMGL